MEDQQHEEAPSCRFCLAVEPPRGLADLLLDQPCGCRGTQAHIHLSCLHAWQLHRLAERPLEDPATCDLCRQPYSVPEQLWDGLEAAGGIPAGERQLVREQQQWMQGPGRLWQLQRQGWAEARQELAQALQRLPPEQRQRLQPALAPLRQLEQQAVQRAGGAEPGEPRGLQGLAQGLHGCRTDGGWLLKAMRTCCWLCHSAVPFIDSSELPATEPPRPALWRRLLPDACVTAGVLGLLALSELQQLGSWRAVWRRGYSAWYARRAALPFALLALSAVVQHQAGADHTAPGAPVRQRPLADVADALAECSALFGSLAVTYWPSLLSVMCWWPRAAWAVVRSCLPCLLWKPAGPVHWPAMSAVLEGLRLNRLWQAQMLEDAERAATASRCLALLQQRPGAMRRFAAAVAPASTRGFGRFLSRFLSTFAPFA